jgi:hypothetical protein
MGFRTSERGWHKLRKSKGTKQRKKENWILVVDRERETEWKIHPSTEAT